MRQPRPQNRPARPPTAYPEASRADEVEHYQPFDRAQDKSKIQNLVEPLSDRELEILHLVADGLSNSAIADEIIVTVGTVKKHLNNIYGKLGVASRTQAIAQARMLNLL